MPSRTAASSRFDSTAQICCGLPKPRKAVDGHGVREQAPGDGSGPPGVRYGPFEV